jgi:hypothetical protein
MKIFLSFYTLVISFVSYSQNLDYNNSYESINICTAIQGNNFASERAADSALDDILNVIGASKRFVLQECSNINNAVALTMNGVRYIIYDPEFMTSLSYGDEWSNKFILAHEVGHHINGHTVDVLAANSSNKVSLSTSRIQELESDEFAGFVLGRLGASLSDALSGVQSLSDKDDSYSTHPSRSKRIAAIKKGFKESEGYVDSSNLSISKGKTVDSPYSNSSYTGVKYVEMEFLDGVYEGYVSVKTEEPFGYGEYRTVRGFNYNGEWSDGQYNGYGKQVWANGTSYEGDFVKMIRSGNGVFIKEKGEKHIGNFSEGVLVKGTKFLKGKEKLEGQWYRNRPIRVALTNDDKEIIEYGFLDGSKGNGFTTFTFWDGNKLKSYFKGGVVYGSLGLFAGKNGQSEVRSFIGKTRHHKKSKELKTFVLDFIPEFVQNQLRIPQPKYFDFSNKNLNTDAALKFLREYEGKYAWNSNFSKGVKLEREKGEEINSDPKQIRTFLNNKYGGYSYQGMALAYGEYEWKDGATYKGYFLAGTNSIKAGYGELIYGKDDERANYKGMWFDGKNGYGLLKYKNGKIEKGVFLNNEFHKSEDFDLDNMQKALKRW